MKNNISLRTRIAVLAFLVGVVALGLTASGCKRTWENCYDPGNAPCNPTMQVVNCKNAPACASPGTQIAGCALCASGGAPGCGGGPSCSNSICWQLHAMNFGVKVTNVRAYPAGGIPPVWATPNGGALVIERGMDSDVYNFTFCSASQTPVVGLAGQSVMVEVKGQFDDPDLSAMNSSTRWNP